MIAAINIHVGNGKYIPEGEDIPAEYAEFVEGWVLRGIAGENVWQDDPAHVAVAADKEAPLAPQIDPLAPQTEQTRKPASRK